MVNRRIRIAVAAGLTACGLSAPSVTRAASYTIQSVGVNFGGGVDGGPYSNFPQFLSDSGVVVGSATQYVDNEIADNLAWMYLPSTQTTQIIGLLDAAHTSSTGERNEGVAAFVPNGWIIGSAQRYSGANDVGQDVWLFNPSTGATQIINPTDPAHVSSDGTENGQVWGGVSSSGQIAGFSTRYNGDSPNGSDAWLYNVYSSSLQYIGLTDSSHTATDGRQSNIVDYSNNAGFVLGTAEGYDGNNSLGRSPWLYSPKTNTTVQIGLYDATHTPPAGAVPSNLAWNVNASGQAIGTSVRYSGSTNLGVDTWYYSSSSHLTQVIGPTDAGHTDPTGFRFNEPLEINSTGQVIGSSYRFSGYDADGYDGWLYSPATNSTQMVGLYDALHNNNGDCYNTVRGLNNAGQVVGDAQRYSGAADFGSDAWLFSHSTNTAELIGPTDAAHTETGGYRNNTVFELDQAGQVFGASERFDGTTEEGYDAWCFDSQTGKLFEIDDVPPTGFTVLQLIGVSDSGTAVGYYVDEAGSSSERIFEWTEVGGFVDLGAMVEGGLTDAGWSDLAEVHLPNAAGQFVGTGNLLGDPSVGEAFLLTPVPEPACFTSMVIVVIASLHGQRRSTRAIEQFGHC